jgi:zinc protease
MVDGFRVVGVEHGVEELELVGNGLKVLLLPDPSVPVVASCVVYHVGSRNEATGHTGATHLLEHLMFKGSRKFDAQVGTGVARTLERVGASFNATTWFDRTNYYETVPLEHLGLALEIEADRMRHALLREDDLASELTVVRNELDRGENDPLDVLLKESFAIAFREHPYHHPTIGWRSDVEAATIARLREFYDTFYQPDNATLVLVGAFEREEALQLVALHFGNLPRSVRPRPPVVTVEPRQEGERRFVVRRAGEVGSLVVSWRVPQGSHADSHALAVLSDALTGGVTSRLHQRLVETGKCLDVQAFAWHLLDPGLFQVFATLNPPTTHAEAEAVIRQTISELLAAPLDEAELERVKVQVEAQTAFHRDSPAQVAAALTEAISSGGWQTYFEFAERIRAVTAADVQRVVATYFKDDSVSVGSFVPTNGRGGGTALGEVPRPSPCFLKPRLVQQVVDHTMVNGARLLLLPRRVNCTVHLQGSLLAGHGVLGRERWSAATLLPEMLERGTRSRTRDQIARKLEDNAVELDISGESFSPFEVFVSGRALSRHLSLLIELMADMLRFPSLPEDELAKVKQLRLGELAQAQEDTFIRAFEAFSRLAYPLGHPHCRRNFDERRAGLLAIGREDLERTHRELYGPAALVLALVGDFDPEDVVSELERRFDGWSGGLATPPDIARLTPQDGRAGEARVPMADKPNLDVILGCPAGLRRRDEDYASALVGNAVLGQSTLSSRLGRSLREREGLTYGAVSRFFGASVLDGPWAVTFSVAAGHLERALELARAATVEFVAEGPLESELVDERAALSGSMRVAQATPSGVARDLARLARHGLPLEEFDELPERLLATTRDSVVEAVRRHIDPQRLSVAVAGGLPAAEPGRS